MSYQDCIDVIRKSAGDLSDDDIDSLVTELQRRQKILQATGVIADTEEAAMRAALKISEDLEAAIMLEKRNAAINAKVKLQALEFVARNFADNPAEAVEAMLMGINRPGLGFRDSTAVRQSERLARYTGGFEADLARADLLEVFASGTLDREVARALWKLDVPGSKMDGLPEEAVALAKIIRKHQEYWRQDVNRHGGWVGKLENYIVRQSHDPMKMMRAGYDEWKAGITDRLEWGRILTDMPDKNPEEFLQAVYKGLVSGEHMKAVPTEPTGFKGPGNLAKKLSQERVLHFKSADDWFDYNEQFGTDNLRESVVNGMKQSADAVGLMRTLGTNPKAMLDNLVDTLAQRTADPLAAKALNEKRKTFDNYLANLDGSTKVPVNEMLARVGTTARTVQSTAKLGVAVASQFSDLPIMGSEVKYQGGNLLEGIVVGLKGFVSRIGGTSAEKKEAIRQIGYVADTMIRELGARYSLDNTVGGRMGRLQDTFFKWNLMRWWQDTMETTASLWMSNNMAVKAGQSFDQLGDLSRVLQGAGIDARKWDVIRQGKQLAADGEMYLTPEAMRELPTDALRPYVQSQLDDLYKRTQDKIDSLKARSDKEAEWVESRTRKLMEAHERSAQTLNRVMTSREMQTAKRSAYVEAQKELLQARMERASAEADISAYLAAERQQDQVKRFLDKIAEGKDLGQARAVGERLGREIGKKQQILAQKEANLRKATGQFEREILSKYDDLDARLNEKAGKMRAVGDVEGRITRLAELEQRWAEQLNSYIGTRERLTKEQTAYVDDLKATVGYKFDVARGEADIAINTLQQKRLDKVDAMGERVDRNVQRNIRESGSRGQQLGEKIGRSERRIVEIEKSLRDLEAKGERDVEAKFKELSDKMWERSKELDAYTAEIEARRAKRELIAKDWQEAIGRKEERIFENARDELESNLRSFYVDRTSFAVLRPDPKTRAIALRDLRPGTPEGEVAMMIMQFKSFPISFVQKILGREVYGREGRERWTNLGQLMAATTIFGYMSMAAKDMLKGKEPRDPLDWKTFQAAFIQGGGAGIYGDFLFGEMRSRGGQSLVATLAGPTLGEADRLADIWTRLRNGDDAAAASFKALLANTPFGNHFALRPAADYLFLHSITEALNPGALRRMEEKVSREKEQEWRVRPSENYLDPLGIAR